MRPSCLIALYVHALECICKCMCENKCARGCFYNFYLVGDAQIDVMVVIMDGNGDAGYYGLIGVDDECQGPGVGQLFTICKCDEPIGRIIRARFF